MWKLVKEDARRWVVLGSIAPAEAITLPMLLKLLYRYVAFRAIAWFRFGSWCKQRKIPFLPGYVQRLLMRRYGLEMVISMPVGGGLYIPHPVGTVISARSIGKNCSIIAGVTIGMRNEHRFPVLGDNVFVGAGARVLGGISIGNNAVIGANAVVINDVPTNMTAVGIPARVVRSKLELVEA